MVSGKKNIFFIGIGGIGMSALARYFHARGNRVSGYDRTETELTRQLCSEGMEVIYSDDEALAPRDADLVVYTPAIPASHPQLCYYLANNYPIKKRAQVLGDITRTTPTVGVAGTHGKTTVSTMIAHLFQHASVPSAAFLGGIAVNYGTNFLDSDGVEVVVVEADEFDRSFLNLFPRIAVITSTDADHLDIYGSSQSMHESFCAYAEQVHPEGVLLIKHGLGVVDALQNRPEQVFSYSATHRDADFHAENIRIEGTAYCFDVASPTENIENLMLRMPGLHNVENAVAAVAVAQLQGLTGAQIREALARFSGIKRRFEFVVERDDVVYIDDYAHHPEEIRAFVQGVRSLYPERKITLIFQPHLFSRTRDHVQGFAETLSLADEVILLDIYPARELPIEGVSSQLILDQLTTRSRILCSKAELLDILRVRSIDVLLTVGAGDIAEFVQPIAHLLKREVVSNG